MKYQEKELECIYCNKRFRIGEIFVSHIKSDGVVTISCHLECGEMNEGKEKDGGWIVVKRELKGFVKLNQSL